MKDVYSHMTDEEFLDVLDNTGNGHYDDHEAAKRIRTLRSRLAECEKVMEALYHDDYGSALAYVTYKSKHAPTRLPIEVCVKCGCGKDNHPDHLCNANYQIRL